MKYEIRKHYKIIPIIVIVALAVLIYFHFRGAFGLDLSSFEIYITVLSFLFFYYMMPKYVEIEQSSIKIFFRKSFEIKKEEILEIKRRPAAILIVTKSGRKNTLVSLNKTNAISRDLVQNGYEVKYFSIDGKASSAERISIYGVKLMLFALPIIAFSLLVISGLLFQGNIAISLVSLSTGSIMLIYGSILCVFGSIKRKDFTWK